MKTIDAPRDAPAFQSPDEPEHFEYRSVSKAAVVCVVFALMAIMAFLFEAFVIIPLLGFCFGVAALVNFRRFRNELIGEKAAWIGTIVNALCLVGAIAMHAYIYTTEVPDGYQRISFSMLNPKPKSGVDYSPEAVELDGKKVFVRGYVRPGLKKSKLKKFILVGDFGSCCFGGNPQIYDVVAVNISIDKTVNYGFGLRRIGGTFRLHKRPRASKAKDVPSIIYEIEADHVK